MFTQGKDVARAALSVAALVCVRAAKQIGLVAVDHPRYRPIRPSDVMVPLEMYKQLLLILPAVLLFVWFMEGFLWAVTATIGWMLLMFLTCGAIATHLLERSLERTLAAMRPDERMRYQAELRQATQKQDRAGT